MADSTLARAKAGDNAAFEDLVGVYRRQLEVHCYRMLGSLQDAEDALQETLMAAWRALDRFDGASVRAWLYRIATNRCLNFLNAPRSQEPRLLEDLTFSPEARYDTRESIALSFVAGLQHLPAQQRAALVLRDVVGFSASEVAEMLGVLMPPESFEFRGRAAVVDHLYQTHSVWGQGLKLVPTRANGQPAFGYYVPDRTANLGPGRARSFRIARHDRSVVSPETPPEHAGTDDRPHGDSRTGRQGNGCSN